MPRQLDATMTFDDLEDEVLFTEAAVKADPDAADLAPKVDGWLAQVAAARAAALDVRRLSVAADATRIVANARLDAACTRFGDSLLVSVGKDRTAAKWKTFFSETVSSFIRQALDKQVTTVKGWLSITGEPVLEQHRAELTKWATAAGAAIEATQGVAPKRGIVWQQREALSESLTRERDGLHDALAQRGREKGLARDWADLFFRVESRPSKRATVPPALTASA